MKHIAAYAMLVLGGKDSPSAADVEKVLKDSGVTADSDKIKTLCEALKGKAFNELVAEGKEALSKMGGGAPAASSGAAPAEAKKEEAAPAEEEEEIEMGGFFGDDDGY